MPSRTVTILGSTGSVGANTLDLIRFHKDKFAVEALTANRNAELLIAQALEFRPEVVAIGDEQFYQQVKDALPGIRVVTGEEGIAGAASMKADLCVAAISGMAGLKPLMAALGKAEAIAIANKEPLVAAGNFFLTEAARTGTKILPLDSEHNAIFQVFEEKNRAQIERLILTASGGPFRTLSREETANVTPEQALKHPNWSMGAKISVDSATMMNKALEVIEAHHLFRMPSEKIEVVIHPQSIIHSMVEYGDGSVLAQLGAPDMRTPIAYALAYPDRMETSGKRLDWQNLKSLDFEAADHVRFPALRLAYQALQAGQGAAIALNAANEVAVEAFLQKRIGFNNIVEVVERTLQDGNNRAFDSLEEIISFDRTMRATAESYIISTQ